MKILCALASAGTYLLAGTLSACESTINITLQNNAGGIYPNHKVVLTSKADGKAYSRMSDGKGVASFSLPCEEGFKVDIDNYTRKFELTSPAEGGISNQSLSYAPDMVEKEKKFAMNAPEMMAVDNTAKSLPDTFTIKDIRAVVNQFPNYFMKLMLLLEDIDHKPLEDELVIFTGIKRNKSFKGRTDKAGRLLIYIPKGDRYMLNFLHNKNYKVEECPYTKGTAVSEMRLSYLGTKEIERRKREEADRIAAEEARLKAEKEAFKSYCKRLHISEEEGYRRKLREELYNGPDTVVSAVLNRNQWPEKLIVCDLTGSMLPYSSQLSLWYQLNYKREKNLQFIFFNDGDGKSDAEKVIGRTGGIYYSKSKGMDSLQAFISMVSSRGGGGDCPENNMEALIKGVRMAGPYKELVMIVDNHAPVKDISLLTQFDKPVHIVLCGMDGRVLTDYLNIAYKTRGTIHTIEEDITNLAKMSEGQDIIIGGKTYRIMGGEFVIISRT